MLTSFARPGRRNQERTCWQARRRRRLKNWQPALESLESRTLLATLNIVSGSLSYRAGVGIVNNLSISTTGPAGKYTFTDTENITLGPGAIAAGWTGSGTMSVTGPDASVTSMAVDTRDRNDTVTVRSVDAPLALNFTNAAGNVDTVTIGGDPSKGTQGVNGSVSVSNTNGTTVLVVDDSADSKAVTVSMSSTKITGLLPGTNSQGQPNAIDFSKANLASVTYDEGKGGTTLTVSSTAKAPATTTINTGVGIASVNVTTVSTVAGPLGINAQGTDTITLGGTTHGVQDFNAAVTLTTAAGVEIASLTIDDSADAIGQTASISGTTITGLAPNTIDYSGAAMTALNVKGGEGGNTFTVASLPDAIVTLNTGAGATIDPSNPNANVVNVSNTADPANDDRVNINAQGLDTINLGPSVGINVTGSTKLLTVLVPLTIDATTPNDRVTFTNSAAGSINGAAQVVDDPGSLPLTLDDSADPNPRTVTVTSGVITGLFGAPVFYDPDGLSSLTLIGGGRYATLNINAERHGPVSVVAGANVGSGTVTIDTAPPLIYANVAAVNVTNAADLDLLSQNKNVVTITGDLPTEGKSLTYLAASFTDLDVNARSSNFTAVIDWGDGSPEVPGSIASHGFLNGIPLFDVTSSHNYHEAGTYNIVVSVADLSTAAVPSIIGGIPVTITDLGGSALRTGSSVQVNLVSDGAIPAAHTDLNLQNPWGIAASPTGPFWVGDNRTGVATLYDGSGNPLSPVVTIPPHVGGSPPSTPTGVAFNPHSRAPSTVFDLLSGDPTTPAVFLFVTLDGTISGWNPGVPPPPPSPSTRAILKVDNSASGAVYTGLAVADDGGSTFLYAANFHSGMVEVYDRNFAAAGSFTDSTLPADYAPYNVTNIGGNLYVSFAKHDAAKHDPVEGLGNGFVDEFSPSGVLLERLVSNAPLDEPWGIALAPANFGQFSGDLLIANHGNGRINAFDPATGMFVGPFIDSSNQPVVIDGLHGLSFGNGATAGATNTLFFTAGPGGGAHGLLGTLTPVQNTADIIEAALKASVSNVSAVEGNPFVGVVANFTDDNPFSAPGDFSAIIDWGDGSPPTAGAIIAGNGLGAFLVVVGQGGAPAHIYADETGSPIHPQPLNISVTIAETAGVPTMVSAEGFANVADAALVSATGIDPSGGAVEGIPLAAGPITLATFIDNNTLATPADFITNGVTRTALIDWGDGSTSLGTVVDTGPTALGEGFAVTGDHTYLKVGPSSIKISVNDIGGKSTSMVANVVVVDAPLAPGPPITFTGAETLSLINTTIATFSDANPLALATDFRASIDWGDGSGGSGTIVAGAVAGSFAVLSSHKYTGEGTFSIQVVIDDSAGDLGGSRAIATATATITDAALNLVSRIPITAIEGQPLNDVVVGSFSDTGPAPPISDFSADVVWGDTIVPFAATIRQSAGTPTFYDVLASHTYPEETPTGAPLTLTIRIRDVGGSTLTFTNTATVLDAPISSIGAPSIPGVVGVPLGTPLAGGGTVPPDLAVITDTNLDPNGVLGDFTGGSVLVDWGDGTARDTLGGGNIGLVQQGSPPGVVIVLFGRHTYTAPGDYQISMIIRDEGGSTTVADSEAIITAGPPMPVALPPLGIAAVEGQPLNNVLVGSFREGNAFTTANDYGATVVWGDTPIPFAATIVKSASGFYDVYSSHTYADETPAGAPLPVTVRVADNFGDVVVINNTAAVADAPLQDIETGTIVATAGVPVPAGTLLARFQDANFGARMGDFAATADLGVGAGFVAANVVPLGGGSFGVLSAAAVTYPAPGDYPIAVKVVDVGGSQAGLTNDADVQAPPFKVQFPSWTFNLPKLPEGGFPGFPGGGFPGFPGIPPFSIGLFKINFPNLFPGFFKATTSWGDGSASTTSQISLIGGGPDSIFSVSDSHIYNEEGTYTVTVQLDQLGGSAAGGETDFFSQSIEVTDAPLAADHATADLPEGVQQNEVIGTFTDANPLATASDFTVTVDTGNSPITVSNVAVTQIAGSEPTFKVTADLLAEDSGGGGPEQDGGGLFLTIRDIGGSVAVAASQVNWFDPVLIDPGINVRTVEGTPFQGKVASFSSSDPRATAGEFTAIIDWGDGQASNGAVVRNGSAGFFVVGSHTYAESGSFSVSTTVRNDEGQAVSGTSTATVRDAPIVGRKGSVAAAAQNTFTATVGTFVDSNPFAGAGDFSALINWGDGTASSGVVVASGSATGGERFTVFGSHLYAQRKRYLGSVTIVDTGGARATDSFLANVRSGRRAPGPAHAPAERTRPGTAQQLVLHSSHPHGSLAIFNASSGVQRPPRKG
jgi:uncharacterized protein (TIGR03118 family)